MTHIPIVIVGAGVLGLLLAREIKKNYSGDLVCVFEQEPFPGEHSSSRNSGVLHAGLYYPTDSQKLKFCLEGNNMWTGLAQDLGLSVNRCGKYVIIPDLLEQTLLEELYVRAELNGVEGLSWASEAELSKLRSFVEVKAGFFSSQTGILDTSELIKKLNEDLYKKDVPVLVSDKVESIKFNEVNYIVKSKREELTCDVLINAAGLGAVELRQQLGLMELNNNWIKGNYLRCSKIFSQDYLIYPLPERKLKGLGVHTSFDSAGVLRFGPNTEKIEKLDYSQAESVIEEMYPSIKKLFPTVSRNDLQVDYSGIRSKIFLNGKAYHDFWIQGPNEHGKKGYFELCGIDSPGLTSAPAMAKHIVNLIEI